MARPPRDRSAGIHHVTVGAVEHGTYFRDDSDRLIWIRRLTAVLDHYGWTCLTFCQLTTHLHLLVETPDESLPTGMHRLNSRYAQELNERYGRRGALQRTRYWSGPKRTPDALLAAFRYIARNPVEAGLALHPLDWSWSSFATSCGVTRAFPFVDATRVVGELGGGSQALLDLVR